MPQAGFTPIQTYNSPTAGHIPVYTDLYAGELAINTTDEKLYFKNTGGTVKLLASTAVFTTTGSGSYVLATSPTITGHPTIEGVTSTGATGTGKFVFDSAPTITGHPTIEGVTSTGATGTGKFVFDSAPTITGHPTIEGVTSTGATGTGKFVFDSSPTLSGVTLSDGTANGVAYLNSSKVLTSGSALTFDGTNLVVGGVTSPNYKLASYAVSGNNGITIGNGSNTGSDYTALDFYMASAQKAVIYANSNNLTINSSAGSTIFQTGGTEQMRLTSTGLGLGTSNPGSKLDVVVSGGAQQLRLGSAGNSLFRTRWIDSTTGLGLESLNSNETSYYPLGITGLVLRLNTGDGSTKATLDSSGNLGLGVVPSAWYTTTNSVALQIGTASIACKAGATLVNANAYTSTSGGGWRYITNGYATSYAQFDGSHNWYTAPSGTAGDVLSYTQAMTLDASGNLLVGTTSAILSTAAHGFSVYTQSDYSVVGIGTTRTASQDLMRFVNGNGNVGAVNVSGSGTTFVTSSDYRLKNVVGSVSGSGNRIDALEPIEFDWKSDGTRSRGFLAHKFQEVYPNSVTGEKDAVDEEGNPVYQNMQASTSEVIADLVAELQSLRKRVNQLENKL